MNGPTEKLETHNAQTGWVFATLASAPDWYQRSRVRARLILGSLFFLISLGLGYPGLHRYNPRNVEGLKDTQRYVEMVNGTAAWTAQQELRVLVPFLARPISRVSVGHIGAWNSDFFGLLIVNSFFVAWAAILLLSIGERVTGDRHVATIASLLYLLTFNIANVQLAGLVDSVEAWALLAVTWALFNERWALIPLIGIAGALGKETTVPLLLAFCIAWSWRLGSSKSGSRSLYWATAALLIAQAATLMLIRAGLTGEFLLPWQLVTSSRMFSDLGDALSRTVFSREVLYSFGWLLPLGLLRLRRLPSIWIVASAASLFVMTVLSIWWGVAGNVARPAFNAVGPILTLSVAIFLDDITTRRTETAPA
jgi:hypothetical protein